MVGISLDFSLEISNIEEYEEIIIPAGTSEVFNVEITNVSSIDLYYGIWYRLIEPTKINNDIIIARVEGTEGSTTDMVGFGSTTTTSIVIINKSSFDIKVNIGVSSSLTSTSDIEYLGNKYLITGTTEIAELKYKMAGSYVKYVGDNGCVGDDCLGHNANYTSDTSMGYCYTAENYNTAENFNYSADGWRIAYVDNGDVYLISAGSVECIATDKEGNAFSAIQSSYTESGIKHVANLNKQALNYCNSNYVVDGICSSNVAYAMNGNDFNKITTAFLENCEGNSNSGCGLENTLIDNNGFYWIADSKEEGFIYHWNPVLRGIGSNYSYDMGLRPVIKLDGDINVLSGTGTIDDPYRIYNGNTLINDLSTFLNNGINNASDWDKENGLITTNGSYSHIDAGMTNYEFGDSLSFVVRLKINELNSEEHYILSNLENGGASLKINNNYLVLEMYLDGEYYSYLSNYEVSTNEWLTIVCIYDGTDVSIYVNGIKQDINPESEEITFSGDVSISSMPFYIGGKPHRGAFITSLINATFDDVLIFDRVLSVEEIETDYSDVINASNKEGLLLYYNFK